jgi:hypothetical protein
VLLTAEGERVGVGQRNCEQDAVERHQQVGLLPARVQRDPARRRRHHRHQGQRRLAVGDHGRHADRDQPHQQAGGGQRGAPSRVRPHGRDRRVQQVTGHDQHARDVRGEPGRSQVAPAGAQLQAEPRGRDDGAQGDAAHGIVAGNEGGLGVRLPAWSTATISIR